MSVSEGAGARFVDAAAAYDMDTIFLRMVGLSELTVAARSTAVESTKDIEISLVLDISGSMARERAGDTTLSQLEVLRGAASAFIDIVVTDATSSITSLSLVPYSGQVNAGPLFDHFNTSRVHTYSSCIEFTDSDFDTTSLPAAGSRAQVQHFQWFRFEADFGHEAEWGWCPNDSKPIVPFSNDPVALKAGIASLIAHDGTGTQIGLKWGLGLLDPATRPITEMLVAAGTVDADFTNRPAAFDDPGTMKVVVLMTDGRVRYQQRVRPSAYDSPSDRLHWASNNLGSRWATLSTSSSRNADEDQRVALFLNLCALAKANGVIVFTIGFGVDVDSDAYNEMRSCASSLGHFYHVEGIELASAFQQIATTIQMLRLVE